MKYRKLRIALSVAWGVLAVLLVVLWSVSYRLFIHCSSGSSNLHCTSFQGRALVAKFRPLSLPHDFDITFDYRPPDGVPEPVNNWTGFYVQAHSPWILQAPYWFLVLLSSTFAAAPWFRWHFSLRTLLIATTLFALVLGLVVWASR